jgi:hypothetical protein
VASINQRWFKRIMSMVPRRLLRNQKEIKKIHEEIKVSHFKGQTNKGQQETLRAGKQILKTIISISFLCWTFRVIVMSSFDSWSH